MACVLCNFNCVSALCWACGDELDDHISTSTFGKLCFRPAVVGTCSRCLKDVEGEVLCLSCHRSLLQCQDLASGSVSENEEDEVDGVNEEKASSSSWGGKKIVWSTHLTSGPQSWGKSSQTKVVTSTLDEILEIEQDLRRDAIRAIGDYTKATKSTTVCFMWTVGGRRASALSGDYFRDALTGIRRQHRVPQDKETICAEECFLRGLEDRHPKDRIFEPRYSAAYDLEFGWKWACRAGCGTLLASMRIDDLAGELKEAAGEVADWSAEP